MVRACLVFISIAIPNDKLNLFKSLNIGAEVAMTFVAFSIKGRISQVGSVFWTRFVIDLDGTWHYHCYVVRFSPRFFGANSMVRDTNLHGQFQFIVVHLVVVSVMG